MRGYDSLFQVRTYLTRVFHVSSSKFRTNQVRPVYVMLGQVIYGYVRLCNVNSGYIWVGQVGSV